MAFVVEPTESGRVSVRGNGRCDLDEVVRSLEAYGGGDDGRGRGGDGGILVSPLSSTSNMSPSGSAYLDAVDAPLSAMSGSKVGLFSRHLL